MADDLASEMKRPVPIGLAGLAVIGWILAVYLLWDRARVENDLTATLQAERSAHQQTGTELAAQVETAGALAELETIVQALSSERDTLSQERNTMQE
ncbi:hypothetical protein BH23PSE1_BH23PSE1_17160 [soil metagenome]